MRETVWLILFLYYPNTNRMEKVTFSLLLSYSCYRLAHLFIYVNLGSDLDLGLDFHLCKMGIITIISLTTVVGIIRDNESKALGI